MRESVLAFAAVFFGGLAGGFFGGQHWHDVRDEPHAVEAEHGHGQPIELDIAPDTGFTIHDGEMILVVDGDRVLTFYRDTLAEVCADVPK